MPICKQCQNEFPADTTRNHRQRVYCSDKCRRQANRGSQRYFPSAHKAGGKLLVTMPGVVLPFYVPYTEFAQYPGEYILIR